MSRSLRVPWDRTTDERMEGVPESERRRARAGAVRGARGKGIAQRALAAAAHYAGASLVGRYLRQQWLGKRLEEHREWLDTSGEAGRRLELSGADLSSLSLRGADLRGAVLDRCNLASANMDGARISGLLAHRCQLRGASVRETRGTKPVIAQCRARGLHAQGTRWRAPRVEDSVLRHGEWSRARWLAAELRRDDMRQCAWSGMRSDGMKVRQMRVPRALGRESRHRHLNTKPPEAEPPEAGPPPRPAVSQRRLGGRLKLHGEWLASGGLRGRRLRLSACRLSELDLDGADLRKAVLRDVELQRCSLREARCEGLRIERSLVSRSDWTGATFDKRTSIRDTLLSHNTLDGASGWSAVRRCGKVPEILTSRDGRVNLGRRSGFAVDAGRASRAALGR